jgi:hypothetical protein
MHMLRGGLPSAPATITSHFFLCFHLSSLTKKTMSNHIDIQRAHDANAPKLRDALAADKEKYDCTSCRLIGNFTIIFLLVIFELISVSTGAATFVGLGGFTYFSGHHQLRQQQAAILKSGSRMGMAPRRAGITFMSIGMVGIGLYRLVN